MKTFIETQGLQEPANAEEVEKWNTFLSRFDIHVSQLTRGEVLLLDQMEENFQNCQNCYVPEECPNPYGVVLAPVLTKKGIVDKQYQCKRYLTAIYRRMIFEKAGISEKAEKVVKKVEDYLKKDRCVFSYEECVETLRLISEKGGK